MPFPVHPKYISGTETECGLIFPKLFKEKMQADNGGEIETEEDCWELFPFFDKTDSTRMSRTSSHILLQTAEARGWEDFPQSAVAIAENGCGDYLILKPNPENSKQLGEGIFIWLHETGETEQIAGSIMELIDE